MDYADICELKFYRRIYPRRSFGATPYRSRKWHITLRQTIEQIDKAHSGAVICKLHECKQLLTIRLDDATFVTEFSKRLE